MSKIRKFQKGEFMTTSEGEYSDYCVNGLFKVLIDFDANTLLQSWANETGRKLESGVVESDHVNENIDFLGWINKKGYVEEVNYRELHLGSYGKTRLCSY